MGHGSAYAPSHFGVPQSGLSQGVRVPWPGEDLAGRYQFCAFTAQIRAFRIKAPPSLLMVESVAVSLCRFSPCPQNTAWGVSEAMGRLRDGGVGGSQALACTGREVTGNRAGQLVT